MGVFYSGLVMQKPVTCPTFTPIVQNIVLDRTSLASDVRPDGSELVYVHYDSGADEVQWRSDPWTGTSTLLDSISATSFLGASVAIDSGTGTIYGFASTALNSITMRNVTTQTTIATFTTLGTIDGEYDRARWSPLNNDIYLLTTAGLWRITTAGVATFATTPFPSFSGRVGPATSDGGLWWAHNPGFAGTGHYVSGDGFRQATIPGRDWGYVNGDGHLYFLETGEYPGWRRHINQPDHPLPTESTSCNGPPAPNWGFGWWKTNVISYDNYNGAFLLFWWSDDTGEFYAWRVTGG